MYRLSFFCNPSLTPISADCVCPAARIKTQQDDPSDDPSESNMEQATHVLISSDSDLAAPSPSKKTKKRERTPSDRVKINIKQEVEFAVATGALQAKKQGAWLWSGCKVMFKSKR